MRILVNYQAKDKAYLPALAYLLKMANLEAVSTAQPLQISELLAKAKLGKADAILIANEETLKNLAPGKRPTLDSYRGSRLNFSIPAIVCNSLDHIHSVPHGKWLMEKDIAKFKRITEPSPDFRHKVLKDIEDFAGAWHDLASSLILSYDIETDILNQPAEDSDSVQGGDSIITCCAWTGLKASGQLVTYVLPLVDFRKDHWESARDYASAIQFMQRVNNLKIPKVMQNGCYDAIHSIRYHAAPAYWSLDTMGLAHCEWAELPQTLDFIASYQLYDYIQWKDDADEAKKSGDILKYWAYNAKDAWHTMRILIEQIKTMPLYARKNYANQFHMVYPALYCAFEGIKIEPEVRKRLRAASEIELHSSLSLLRTMFADPNFNPGSWQQVQKYIYSVFGAKKPKIGKSKSCTDEKNLKAVAEQHPLLARLADEILTYRGAQKAIGTYFDFHQLNGRLLYSLDPFGTETDRMACRASSLWVGTQVQNIPSYAKEMLIADEGYELFEIDNNKSEARCTAYLSQDEALIIALEEASKDFYKTLGTLFFQMPYEEVSDFFRNKVLKKIVHGTNYMMGPGTFIENIGIKILHETATTLGLMLVPIPRKNHPNELTIKQFATQLLEAYHKPFNRVRAWYKEIYHEVLTTNRLVSPLGHIRYFFGDISKNHNMLRGAVAHQPQNLSVAILNIGMQKVYKQLVIPSKGECRLKAQVHDSILGQWLIDKRDYYLPRILELLDNPVVIHGRQMRIPVEAKVGPSWKQMKEPS